MVVFTVINVASAMLASWIVGAKLVEVVPITTTTTTDFVAGLEVEHMFTTTS